MPHKGYTFQSLEARFLAKIDILPSGCWQWTAQLNNKGYGVITEAGRGSRHLLAHRYSYERAKGFIWPGLELDHICRNRGCVNPEHLEQVTHLENVHRSNSPNMIVHRSGQCAQGHQIAPENAYFRKDRPGAWNCNVCRRERRKATKHL